MQGATRFIFPRAGEKRIFFVRLLLSLALCASAFPLNAARDHLKSGDDQFEFDESLVEKWKEAEVALPAYPRDENLLPVSLLPTDTLKIYIDRRSLSRGADRVARYTLVVESRSGARSVFYDGLRCETREYKTYAVGNPEGSFAPVRQAVWRPIPRPASNAFRHQLYTQYICGAHSTARTPEELVRLLTREQ